MLIATNLATQQSRVRGITQRCTGCRPSTPRQERPPQRARVASLVASRSAHIAVPPGYDDNVRLCSWVNHHKRDVLETNSTARGTGRRSIQTPKLGTDSKASSCQSWVHVPRVFLHLTFLCAWVGVRVRVIGLRGKKPCRAEVGVVLQRTTREPSRTPCQAAADESRRRFLRSNPQTLANTV